MEWAGRGVRRGGGHGNMKPLQETKFVQQIHGLSISFAAFIGCPQVLA